MAEYSAAEHFNNPSRQRVPVVEFTLPLEPTAVRQPGGNFIHKTTSETLRLTDQLHPNQTGPSSTGQTVDIKKTSSFQITSVRVSSSISNDGEDDSCGEVDDSQTEPSEVGSHNHIDVDGDLDTGGDDPPIMFVSNVPVSLAQQQVNEGGALKLEDKDHGLQRRFRVVKIESAEPFKRGRWLCMDFLDQPSVQPTLSKEEPGSGASSSGSLSDHISGDDMQHPHPTSTLHQSNQTLQSISSGAALNSCNQQAQPSSSIHVVPHSLPASAASVNYPQTQQQLLQQPIYQTQPPVPLVYPVSSVSMLQQPTVAAAATSNPASLAIPLITSQPTSSVTAGATLPSLSSNVAQPFVQQPVPPGLLQQQQTQQPPMASQPAYTAPPVAQQQQQQQQQQYVTPAATIQPGMTTQQHLPPQPQQTAQPVVAQIPVMAQQNLMSVPPSSSNNGAAQSSPHPPATALIQPSTSIPTQASSMHPVVLLPPPASLQQQPQPAPVVTVPIHGPPPGLIPQHPHPPIGLQQQQQQPGIQGQPTGAFVEVSTNPPVQSIQPSTQQLHQQQHVSQPSAAVVQPIGVPSIPTLQQQQQQQPEVVMQQQPVQQMQPIQQHVQQQSGSILMQQPQQQQQTLVQQSVVYGSNNLTMPTPVMSVATSMQPQVQLIMAGPSTVTTAVVSSSSSTSAPPGGEAAMGTLHGAGILSKSQSVVQDDGHAGSGVSTDDHASASGSSTVAIDNKIEQAMDLVKSHLMFAVREEVEVLKERIDVLMERIAYLESENQILRAAATQETLAQIAQLEATFPGSGTDNSGGSSVSVVGVASSIGAIVNNTITSTTTTTSTTTSCTSSQIPNGSSPAP